MLNYIQVWRADGLNNDARNNRKIVRDFDRPRGQILSAEGAVLARTVAAPEGDAFEFQREYPGGDLFGQITGYFNFNFGATGIEDVYNDQLSGNDVSQQYQTLRDLFTEGDHTGDVTLTLRADVQQVARDALGERNGAVVAVDPRDGSILALWGFPSFDPNPLASHDNAAAQATKVALEADPNKPLRGKTWQERYFPGSTFKVVTASVGLESGTVTPDQPNYPVLNAYDPPDGEPISNFGGSSCGGTLFDILRVSCNSSFAEMGAETIGPDGMRAGVAKFGYNEEPPIDLPNAAVSGFGQDVGKSKAFAGQSAIGQFTTQASPLQVALSTAAVANGGIIMAPHVMKEIRDEDGDVTDSFKATPWTTAMNPGNAQIMRDAMVGVVEQGTGRAARIPGFVVGGKTGTAQIDPGSNAGVLAWFTAFAGPEGETPTVAIAVLVENQVGVSETTGGQVSAPIAKVVLEKILETQAAG